MPRVYPQISPQDINHDSERVVYEALLRLGDEYVVMHSFPWLRPSRDLVSEPLHEGEADFVILHPEYGLLVLEVKGGTIEYKDRAWFRSGRQIKDPFEQARRNRYALLDAVEERTKNRIRKVMFTHGDAVIFPHCKYTGDLPLNSDPRIFVDADDLENLDEKLLMAFQAWKRSPKSMNAIIFDEIIETLMPKLRLMRCVGAELLAENQRIIQVTKDQGMMLRGLVSTNRVLVEGTAGSGKTLLAMEFAVTMVQEGQNVLVLCFNRHLAKWLQEQAKIERRLQNQSGTLEISTYHSFAIALARKAGVQFEIPEENLQVFWDEEVPLILEQAIDVLKSKSMAPMYDSVIVDEAQDFSPDWWVTVESLSKKGRNGRLYAFLDLHQSLRGEPKKPSVPFPTVFNLSTNCRNTQSIAKSANGIVKVDFVILQGSPIGEVPTIYEFSNTKETVKAVQTEVAKLLDNRVLSNQIVLIGPKALTTGLLAGVSDICGIPLIDDASDWRRGGGILVTTARAFKGLEADVVVLYDLDSFSGVFTKTDLYVAWTRARHRILILCHGTEIKETIKNALVEVLNQDR